MIVNKYEHVKPQLDPKPETPTAQLEHNWNALSSNEKRLTDNVQQRSF